MQGTYQTGAAGEQGGTVDVIVWDISICMASPQNFLSTSLSLSDGQPLMLSLKSWRKEAKIQYIGYFPNPGLVLVLHKVP